MVALCSYRLSRQEANIQKGHLTSDGEIQSSSQPTQRQSGSESTVGHFHTADSESTQQSKKNQYELHQDSSYK